MSQLESPFPVVGEINIGNVDAIYRQFRDTLQERRSLVLDLSQINECDTTALQLLCAVQKTAAQMEVPFRIVALSKGIETAAAELGLSLDEFTGTNPGDPSGGI